nr:hypothetical protein BaRGS_027177 [Batillaria attramentaria]
MALQKNDRDDSSYKNTYLFHPYDVNSGKSTEDVMSVKPQALVPSDSNAKSVMPARKKTLSARPVNITSNHYPGKRPDEEGSKGFCIAKRNGLALVVPNSRALEVFENLPALRSRDLPRNVDIRNAVRHGYGFCCSFDESVMRLSNDTDHALGGYRQSWKYFESCRDDLKKALTFRKDIVLKASQMLADLRRRFPDQVLVGVHIRMEDFLSGKDGRKIASPEYYKRAMTYFRRKFHVVFVAITKKPKWWVENVQDVHGVYFQNRSDSAAADMNLLSRLDHIIMSVGTFGWWAAYFNEGTVVYCKDVCTPNSKYCRSFLHNVFDFKKKSCLAWMGYKHALLFHQYDVISGKSTEDVMSVKPQAPVVRNSNAKSAMPARNNTLSARPVNITSNHYPGKRQDEEGSKGFCIAKRNGLALVVPNSRALEVFENLPALRSRDLPRNVDIRNAVRHGYGFCCSFDESVMRLSNDTDHALGGYRQSWKYFESCRDDLKKALTFRKDIVLKASQMLADLRRRFPDQVLVGVHIRMEDFLSGKDGRKIAPPEYYKRAMTYFRRKFHDVVVFVVITTKPKWWVENVQDVHGVYFQNRSDSAAADMNLLSRLDHIIMSVGTFGWWAAYFNEGIVVYSKDVCIPNSKYCRSFLHNGTDHFYPEWIGF